MAISNEQYAVHAYTTEHGLTDEIERLPVGEVLLTRRAGGTMQQIGKTATIIPNERYRQGREDAVSGIYFADMMIQTTSGHETTQPIAIKPLKAAWMASDEIRKANTINALSAKDRPHVSGSPITFTPLGAYRDPASQKPCVITRFEQGVESFDNLFNDTTGGRISDQLDRSFALASAAEGLIFLHENGYIHTDYQVKNTAADTIGTRVIDITYLRKHRRYNATDLKLYMEDIQLYIRSMSRYTEATPSTIDIVTEHFVELYRQNIDAIYPPQLQSAANFQIDSIDVPALIQNR